jgi:hypothetical protein
MPDAPVLYTPCFCAGGGSLIGIFISACVPINNCLPVILGSSIGGGIGCFMCLGKFYIDWKYPNFESEIKPEIKQENPIIVQNIYIVYQIGLDKK